MSIVYVIMDDCEDVVGMVENKKDIVPYLVCNDWLDLDTLYDDFDITLIQLLECDNDNKKELIKKFNELPYRVTLMILHCCGYTVEEKKIWNYGEYLHNHALD